MPFVYCPVIGQGVSEIMIAAFKTIVMVANLYFYSLTQKTPDTSVTKQFLKNCMCETWD